MGDARGGGRRRTEKAAEAQKGTRLYVKSAAEEALNLSEQSLQIWTATSSASNPGIAQAHTIHAYALGLLGRTREAALELTPAVQVLASARGSDDPAVRRA